MPTDIRPWHDSIDWPHDPAAAFTFGLHTGYELGRDAGYQAGREGLAGELVVALKLALSGVDQDDTRAVLRVLAAPVGEIVARHLRLVDQVDTRRTWDRTASQPRPGDRLGTGAAA